MCLGEHMLKKSVHRHVSISESRMRSPTEIWDIIMLLLTSK